jgi:hypothetical protein
MYIGWKFLKFKTLNGAHILFAGSGGGKFAEARARMSPSGTKSVGMQATPRKQRFRQGDPDKPAFPQCALMSQR